MGFPSGSAVKNLPAMQGKQEVQLWSLGQEDLLEELQPTPGGLLSVRLQRVEHNLATEQIIISAIILFQFS